METLSEIVTPKVGLVLASRGRTIQVFVLMFRLLIKVFCFVVLAGGMAGSKVRAAEVMAPAPKAKKVSVIVIPVKDEIDEPVHYVLRRGLKQGADVVVLDMDTLGGNAGTALDIMEDLVKFQGTTITYVDEKAMSAGAFIASATDEIWFSQFGKMGAAAPVQGNGQDIPETMKDKMVSFLRVSVRSVSEGKGYRGQVISAMIDKGFELKIGDKVIREKGGELLSLTANEAIKSYGEPPQPLLAVGLAKGLDDLLTQKYGAGNYEIKTFEVTWSETLAQYLNAIKPLLLGLGMLALFIEFKTPGFGVFGVTGVVLLAIVFLSSYVSGLSGHEPILVFAIGVILLALELVFFHTAGVLGVVGLTLMAGSLVWAMADFWPNQPISVTWSSDMLLRPVANLALGLMIAAALAGLLLRFMPKGWVWDRIVLSEAVASAAQVSGVSPTVAVDAIVGQGGIAITPLRPTGEVEIGGRRYQAQLAFGSAAAGEKITVVGRTDFGLKVEKVLT